MHLSLLTIGVKPGDEVVTPSFTFAAGAQCVVETGATPVFCDVDPATLSVNVETIEPLVSDKTKAIIVVPYAGRPLGIQEICSFAGNRGIAVIEDAAHAAGMLDRGAWAGVHSMIATYSFYATKNITTAEGGMLLTNDDAVATRVRRLSLHGMSHDAWDRYRQGGSWRYDVTEPGFKYNMPDISAALGLEQLGRLGLMQKRRDEIAQAYIAAIAELPGLTPQAAPANESDRHSWCMFAVLVDSELFGLTRDELVVKMRELNIGTSVHYIPTHHLTAYKHLATRQLPETDRIADRVVSLPLYPAMSESDVRDVIAALQEAANASKVGGAVGQRERVV